ncbi:MAG: prepilin peptidase [Dehalococcoidia bacterium]
MILAFFLIGIVFGSFLNVVIDRLPAGQSLLRPPSHCPNCGQRLRAIDLIPLVSYLWLGGRCRYCKARIPRRIFWVELATGLIFALLWWRCGLSAELGILAVYSCVFIVIFVIDLDHTLILNKVVYPASVFALATVPLRSDDITITSSLIGGGIGIVLLGSVVWLVPLIISREAMGLGDVKMAGLMGLATGFPVIFVAVFVGIVAGGLIAMGLIVLKLRGRKDYIPFGPFLAIGAMVALVWGNTIWDWYTPGT